MRVDIFLEEPASFFRKQKGLRIFFLFLIGFVVVIGAQGCDSKNGEGGRSIAQAAGLSCGKFDCLHSKTLLPNNIGAEYKVQFKFKPADCGDNCRCEKIAYVQIARLVLHDGTYYDDGSFTDLIVKDIKDNGEEDRELNGWFIDVWPDAKYGYYGRKPDGEFHDQIVGVGQNKNMPEEPAWLFDQPSGIPKDSLIEFVDIPVCLDPTASCKNKLLGFSHWWFIVGSEENTPSIEGPRFNLAPNEDRLKILQRAVHLAVTRWNESAPSRGEGIVKFPDDMSAMR
jgi:hypothetical protein